MSLHQASLHLSIPSLIPRNNLACSISLTSGFSVGVTITKGVNLDLAKIVGAGVSTSVATSKTTSNTQGVTANCPKGKWHCSLSIRPQLVEVSGTISTTLSHCSVQHDPYTVIFPKTGKDGIKGAEATLCVCKNKEHWADPGAPTLACPQDCA